MSLSEWAFVCLFVANVCLYGVLEYWRRMLTEWSNAQHRWSVEANAYYVELEAAAMKCGAKLPPLPPQPN